MWSDQLEKRVASSIFITLAPPRRNHLASRGDEARPAGAPHLPKEARRPPGPGPPQTLTGVSKGGSRGLSPGVTGVPSGGCSAVVPPPSVLPSSRVDSDRTLFLPLPPLECHPAPFSMETFGPDLEKRVEERWQQRAATLPAAEVKPPGILPSRLSRDGEQQTEGRQVEAAVPTGVCAFCHKGLSPRALAVEAMNKQYHADCFACRTCRRALAGQRFYQEEGRPLCVDCYKSTLEKCARCQAVILSHTVRAMGNQYHPECFTCVLCGRSIGDETFALDGETGVLCLQDFYRKFASVCGACEEAIIPSQGRDSYRVECLGRHFHQDCYRCEICRVLLSPGPTEGGCYPLGNRLLCKSCNIRQKEELSC